LKDISDSLNNEYNKKLIEKGYCFSRDELKSKNRIDVRKLADLTDTEPTHVPSFSASPTREEFISQTGWLSCIPCFNEAVFRVNTFRYIYYRVENIDSEHKNYKVFLHDYLYSHGEYTCGAFGRACIQFSDNMHKTAVSSADVMLFSEIYRLLSQEELGWGNMQMDIWNTLTVQYADEVQQQLKTQHNTNQFQELVKIFVAVTTIVNEQLYLHKPSRPIRKSNALSKDKINTTNAANSSQPEKVVRNIGIISITSAKPPKMPTERSIVRYNVAEWETRGHIRTMKSGKQIYIQPHINHRHALEDKDIEKKTPQQIIKFVNKEQTTQ
jgi:hypothetical protein